MANSRFSVSPGGILTPTLRRVQVRAFAELAVPVGANTIIGVLPEIPAMHNPVVIEFAGVFNNSTGLSVVGIVLYRNGVQIADVSDTFGASIGVSPALITTIAGLWMDETPGLKPVYDIRANSSQAGTTTTSRRAVAHT